jgi:hypothetical protein
MTAAPSGAVTFVHRCRGFDPSVGDRCAEEDVASSPMKSAFIPVPPPGSANATKGCETYRRRWGGVTLGAVLIAGRLASRQFAAFGLRSMRLLSTLGVDGPA